MSYQKRYYLFSSLLIIFFGFSLSINADTKNKNTVDIDQLAHSYQSSLQLVTQEPVHVNPEVLILCIGATKEGARIEKRVSGPHAYTMVNIYMNDLAIDAFPHADKHKFPEGSVIVKEKYGLKDREGKPVTGNGVGGMVKRHSGYDTANGDWEYFYFEDPNSIESGKIESCVQCHSSAFTKKDHVYGGWSPD